MTKMEQNNLEAQLSLYEDVISEYRKITYSVNQAAGELENLLMKRTEGTESDTWLFKSEDIIDIVSKVRYLKEQQLKGINSYCKDSMDKIEQNQKLIQILNKK